MCVRHLSGDGAGTMEPPQIKPTTGNIKRNRRRDFERTEIMEVGTCENGIVRAHGAAAGLIVNFDTVRAASRT